MMEGFFKNVVEPTKSKPIPTLIPHCGACGLYRHCHSPKMKPSGDGRRKILIIGEAPGKNEDLQNIQFVGDSGQLLQGSLRKIGVDMRKDCWITNAIICRPENNRTPTSKEIEYCRPNIIKTVKELRPEIIITLGGSPVSSLLGWLWKEDVGAVSKWVGWQIPCQELNCWICPTFHPSFILHTEYGVSQRENEVRRMFFERYLHAAFELEGRPWRKVPEWRFKVKSIFDTDEAAEIVESMIGDKPVAIDLETNMLKPDGDKAEIVCCSVSDGERTIAYPWSGKVVKKTRELIRSGTIIIGYNTKFEERWFMKEFGHGVKNWGWDGMLATHVLDNRKDICSLKFQAFVQLGMPDYSREIEPFLKADGANEVNRIREVQLNKLLLYCGLDSLLEWKLWRIQKKERWVL